MKQKRETRSSSKSNAGALFNRYVWLVDTIYRAGRISFEEINERWLRSSLNDTGEELPIKTFHNHKNAIQQMFDIDIACDRRGGYGSGRDGIYGNPGRRTGGRGDRGGA